jgi:hypothetical protein
MKITAEKGLIFLYNVKILNFKKFTLLKNINLFFLILKNEKFIFFFKKNKLFEKKKKLKNLKM